MGKWRGLTLAGCVGALLLAAIVISAIAVNEWLLGPTPRWRSPDPPRVDAPAPSPTHATSWGTVRGNSLPR